MREGGWVYFSSSFKDLQSIMVEGHDTKSVEWLVTSHPESGRRQRWMFVLIRTLSHGMVLPTFRLALPTSVNQCRQSFTEMPRDSSAVGLWILVGYSHTNQHTMVLLSDPRPFSIMLTNMSHPWSLELFSLYRTSASMFFTFFLLQIL